jgi:hypothetical protein
MSAPLTQAEVDRLRNIVARLDSDFEGERAAAALLATRLLKSRGLIWSEVVLPPPARPASKRAQPDEQPWRRTVGKLLARPGSLRAWEREEFLPSLLRFESPKQSRCLRAIADRVLGPEA